MKSLLYLVIGILLFQTAKTQDSVMQRIIIIGDAGEMDAHGAVTTLTVQRMSRD